MEENNKLIPISNNSLVKKQRLALQLQTNLLQKTHKLYYCGNI